MVPTTPEQQRALFANAGSPPAGCARPQALVQLNTVNCGGEVGVPAREQHLEQQSFLPLVHDGPRRGTLRVAPGAEVTATVRFGNLETANESGENPAVLRVDLIVGQVRGPANDRNPTTRVFARFTRDVLTRDADRYAVRTVLPTDRDLHVRVRGTSTEDIEPPMDGPEENLWHAL